MPIVYDAQAMLVQFLWESANFASGRGTTSLGLATDVNGVTEATTLIEGVRDAWAASLRPVTDSDWTLEALTWETATFSGEVFAGLAGGETLVSPPPNTSILLSYSAAEKGPRNRGRQYWPGMLPEGQLDERGVVAPARVTGLQNAFTAFYDAVAALPLSLGQHIPQTTYPGQASPPNLPWPLVITRAVSPIAATQRRRMRA